MHPFLPFLSYILTLFILAALAWRDIQDYILPNYLNAALVLSFSAFHISINWQLISPTDALLGAFFGGGMLLTIRFLANKFYREDSLGLGDVKLMAAAGVGLGFPNIFLALSAGAFAGLLHGAVMALVYERRTGQKIKLDEINVPAGLGLCVGIVIVLATQFRLDWVP